MRTTTSTRLIETNEFPFEFLSSLGERESWRKEVHRPIYHVHKWWAKRLGTVFRGILLGCQLPKEADLATEFYRVHDFAGVSVFDPFMGSGTTIGEAHKLGLTALGRDINPVAVRAVRTALGPLDRRDLERDFRELAAHVGPKIRRLYLAKDSTGRSAEALYYFWVMSVSCPHCRERADLFPSWIIARNAYPDRKPEIRVLCPNCESVFSSINGKQSIRCASCDFRFDPTNGTESVRFLVGN